MMPPNRRLRPARPPPSPPTSPPPLETDAAGPARPPAPGGAPPRPPWLPRAWSAVRMGLGVVGVVGASVVAGWLARRQVTTSPGFAVTSIEVEGQDRRPAAAIVAESGVAVGANIFTLDLDAARASIAADPWIADATLARRLPGTVVIQVRERRAAALVALGDTLLATPDGEPFKKLEPGDPVDLPLVTGLTPEGVADDREQARRQIQRAIDLAAAYEHAALSRREPLEEVHVDASGGFTLEVGRPPIDLVLGGPPFRRKLDQAARVIAELDERRAKAQAIMLDNEAHPERVVARLR
jgi:cell division protein FtsQ